MKKFLLFGFTLLFVSSYGQPAGMTEETWYLRYLNIDAEIYFTPLGEDLTLSFFENTGDMFAEANGIENVFSSGVSFAGSSLTFTNPAVTLADCTSPNCPFEDQYFYEVLTTILMEEKFFIYTYNEYSGGLKDLWIRDNDLIKAYFTNYPIDPDPAIFQTWYLFETGVDMGDSYYHYGPDVPRITIAPDFTFTGVNGSINFEGHFSYGEDFVTGFKLILESLSDPDTGIPDLVDYVPLTSFVDTDVFSIESSPGFYSVFKNTITLGIPEHNEQSVIIYPNPVQDNLFIKTSADSFFTTSITDVHGRLVETVFVNNLNEIDISGLKAGMYFLKMESLNGTFIKKFIKK